MYDGEPVHSWVEFLKSSSLFPAFPKLETWQQRLSGDFIQRQILELAH